MFDNTDEITSTVLNILLKELQKENDDICFFSLIVGSDTPFYDKECVEDGNFAWTDYKLNHTIFINPAKLYEEKVINRSLFRFVDNSGEEIEEDSVKEK